MITLYIVRHGTTIANTQKIVQGQVDTPLTEKGKRDARILAKALKGIQFDAAYASDLGRAFMTEFIITHLNHEEQIIHTDKRLRERNYGLFNEHPKEEIMQKFPQYRSDPDLAFPQGESFHQMQKRVCDFLYGLETRHHNQKILIVTHSGSIRGILQQFLNQDMRKTMYTEVPHHDIHVFTIEKKQIKKHHIIHAGEKQ